MDGGNPGTVRTQTQQNVPLRGFDVIFGTWKQGIVGVRNVHGLGQRGKESFDETDAPALLQEKREERLEADQVHSQRRIERLAMD